MSPSRPAELVGGRYRLLSLAGRGGMAEVWRAELLGTEGFTRPVALKRILKSLVHLADHRAMFVQEARLTAQLDHPNVVQVHDFGEDDAGLYIVMEWVEGLSLRDLLDVCTQHETKISPALAAAIGIEVLRGLEAAHENQHFDEDGTAKPLPIIHRDVSPSNVMLSVRGVVKLADFGLARALHRANLQRMTPAGVVKGKLAYMAPEVVQGRPASPVSDLYSTGVLLWETLAGRRLFDRKTDYDIVMSLVRGERAAPIATLRPDVPPVIAQVVDRALNVDPAQRYGSAEAFARALSDALRTVPERTDKSRMAREFAAATSAFRAMRMSERAEAALAAAKTASHDPVASRDDSGPVLETGEESALTLDASVVAGAPAEAPLRPVSVQGSVREGADRARPGRPRHRVVHDRGVPFSEPSETLDAPIDLGRLDATGHVRIPPTPAAQPEPASGASTEGGPTREKR